MPNSVRTGKIMLTILFSDGKHLIDVAEDGWALVDYNLEAARVRRAKVTVPGMDGNLDFSTALTGEMTFDSRKLSIQLDCCAGTCEQRQSMLASIVNAINGRMFHIILPDDQTRYLSGVVSAGGYNGDAVCDASITADCDPWRYKNEVTTVTRDDLTANYKTLSLNNERKSVVPEITVTSETTLLWGTDTYTISAGTHLLPDICLKQGANTLKAKLTTATSGSITVTYQEASL